MTIKRRSCFKDESASISYFEEWVKRLEQVNGRTYERITINSLLGQTQVYGINTKETHLPALVIFPGARTTSLIWDFDRGLDNLNQKLRIFLIETNGLPNLSDGSTPDIKSLDYGHWANDLLNKLKIDKAFIAGASFGGLITMKLGITNPEKIYAAFLLNPGCLQSFSLRWKNLYYNLLPIIKPTENNVIAFSENAVFSKPTHQLSKSAEALFVEYEIFAISRYKDRTQKPYDMDKELSGVKSDTYLLEGTKDTLFPYEKSIAAARKHLKHLKDIRVFENVGHGIETYSKAMNYIGERIQSYR